VQKVSAKVRSGEFEADAVSLETIESALDTANMPDPDLLIRTGGEKRISNFLMWQMAYAELVFIDDYWPDFNRDVFCKAIAEYQNRERRFGGLKVQTA
jgi:undecaprenyl diphosphate synthase